MLINAIYSNDAPAPIGSYSQAIGIGDIVYLSGQIPIHPTTMELISGDIYAQVTRVFENIKSVAEAAGGCIDSIIKLTVFLTDLNDITADLVYYIPI